MHPRMHASSARALRFGKRRANIDSIGASGRLTQWLECDPHTVEVTGSNPVPPISERLAIPRSVGFSPHEIRGRVD